MEDTDVFYDRFEVPVLYDKWEGTVDLDHLFRGPILLKAIWLYLVDTQLVRISDETKVNYTNRHRIYVARIHKGLQNIKAILFPHSDEPHAMGNQHAEDDEDLNDIFDNAPSVSAIPTSTLQLAIPVTSLHTDSSLPTIYCPHASGRSAPPTPASTPSGLEFTVSASAAAFVYRPATVVSMAMVVHPEVLGVGVHDVVMLGVHEAVALAGIALEEEPSRVQFAIRSGIA
ncbi:hypothetical protein DFH07DRAFT_974029 [Mycena maculata]|uniref:Uncharacterized protein n=1 Tax=Mycena maculata TaxID=230809 RepID=A0AAD7MG84_9AGAR|nr:hypothetical protein DFH07DRAFT_974029 [Mycena maculata]